MRHMDLTTDRVLRYWHLCLLDGTLGTGRFHSKALRNHYRLSTDEIKSGVVSEQGIQHAFSRSPKSEKVVAIRFYPLVVCLRNKRGQNGVAVRPEFVAPIVSEAELDRNGHVFPGRTLIPRDLLSPLSGDALSIGTVSKLEKFLLEEPFEPQAIEETEYREYWQRYLQYCRRLLDCVGGSWPTGDPAYLATGSGLIATKSDTSKTTRQIAMLYEHLLENTPETPLLSKISSVGKSFRTDSSNAQFSFVNRLGHASDKFPLSRSQAEVVGEIASAQTNNVVAVNGPPGTGKTTLILSVVADQWVRAALGSSSPPIIVAASTNNQAVTNIIDAFGSGFANGCGPLSGRWLPHVKSFGAYLSSISREAEATEKYQTERFFAEIETVENFKEAKTVFLENAANAFPEIEDKSLDTFLAKLRLEMQTRVTRLKKLDIARVAYERSVRAVAKELGNSPQRTYEALKEKKRKIEENQERNNQLIDALAGYRAEEPLLLAIFSFFPGVAKKRLALATQRVSLKSVCSEPRSFSSISELQHFFEERALRLSDECLAATNRISECKELLLRFSQSEAAWDDQLKQLDPGLNVYETSLTDVDDAIDKSIRFELFLLATHVWECRWLQELESGLPNIENSHTKKGRASVIPRWQRRMMLAPCAVSTFATLPGKMSFSRHSDNSYYRDYLYNFIDLLIVDEAGQVLPETAGASFSFARSALVIGDTQQIEPISKLPQPVDIGNLVETNLLPKNHSAKELELLSSSGVTSTGGNVMSLAQNTCSHWPYPELERGFYLLEHRRCFNEIISFCNELCYQGNLIPMRSEPGPERDLPPLGYLHIDGIAISSRTSRANLVEAQTIASWLADNQSKLESVYGLPIEKIVGIVTPFGRQSELIQRCCAEIGLPSYGKDKITIGTVHSLQGAERPIVIFSSVYTKHSDGSFIDTSKSILNVAVSRAKDSFLVFGDMDVFSNSPPNAPRGLLAQHLFRAKNSALDFKAPPRTDLVPKFSQLQTLNNCDEHDTYLLEQLSGTGKKYSIASPWIIISTMKQTGIFEAMKNAVNRGASVEVFVDPALNSEKKPGRLSNLDEALMELGKIGVSVNLTGRLHSKVFTVDETQLCIGSYNWLSADRKGKYVRHETSFVYSGTHLQNEIQTVLQSLRKRVVQG